MGWSATEEPAMSAPPIPDEPNIPGTPPGEPIPDQPGPLDPIGDPVGEPPNPTPGDPIPPIRP